MLIESFSSEYDGSRHQAQDQYFSDPFPLTKHDFLLLLLQMQNPQYKRYQHDSIEDCFLNVFTFYEVPYQDGGQKGSHHVVNDHDHHGLPRSGN
jgi:hypothetical protein